MQDNKRFIKEKKEEEEILTESVAAVVVGVWWKCSKMQFCGSSHRLDLPHTMQKCYALFGWFSVATAGEKQEWVFLVKDCFRREQS